MKLTRAFICLLLTLTLFPVMSMAEAEEPFVMTILTQSYLAEYPSDDAEVLTMMEAYTNTELDITWMFDSMTEKISTTLASGANMPMVIMVSDVKAYFIVNAVKAGVFWDLEPYIDQFPNLKEMYSEPVRKANASINGGTYGLFRKRPLGQNGIIFRKDWAETLGFADPVTIDDYYNMLKAFSEQDPDGNGKDDTYGMTLILTSDGLPQGFDVMLGAFGAANRWLWEDGAMKPDFMTQEYLDTMNFYKTLYDEQLINLDFVINKELYNDFNTGRSGAYISFMSNAGNLNNELFALNPDASIELVGLLEGPKGLRTLAETGFAGEYLFTKAAIPDEETLLKCMNFFDKLSDEEMQNLLRWGLEDKHYYINEDGVPVRPAEWNTAYTNEVNCFRTFKLHYDELAMQGVSDYAYQRARELYVSNEPYAVANPCLPLISDTELEIGKDLALIVNDAVVRYIVGEVDGAGFQAAIDTWLQQGGQQVIEEYTAAYLEAQPK